MWLLFLVFAGSAQAQSWTARNPMPTARWGVASAQADGLIYVMGGQDDNGQVLDVVERYDPATDTWTTVAPLGDEVFNAASVFFEGKIYVLGGRDKQNRVKDDVQVYDPDTNTWASSAGLEEKREGATVVIIDGTMHVAGGSDEEDNFLDDVESFDTATGMWQDESMEWTLDTPRASHASVVSGAAVYTFGGFSAFGPSAPVQRYEPGSGASIVTSLNPARGNLSAAMMGSEIFVMGGRSSSNQVVNTVDIFDPVSTAWRAGAPLTTEREGFAVEELNGTLYVFGGRDNGGNVLGATEAFGGNRAPVAADDPVATPEDTDVNVNVVLNDSDPDGDGLSIISFTQPAHGTVTQPNSVTLRYSPASDYNGDDLFSYTISDGTLSATANVSVIVTAVNDAPVFVSVPLTAAEQDMLFTYEVQADDVDGDALLLTAPELPGWLMLTDHGDGTATLSGMPGSGDAGSHAVRLRVDDGELTAEQPFTVTVNNANSAPQAVDDVAELAEDEAVDLEVLLNDSDVDGNALAVSAVTDPSNGTATVIAGGQRIRYVPDENYNGDDTFDYTVSDGSLTATATVSLTITAVNDAPSMPVITSPTDGAVVRIEGAPDDPFTVVWDPAIDADGDTVDYTWVLATSADFSSVLVQQNVSGETQFTTDLGTLAGLLTAQGVGVDEEITLFHRVLASDGSVVTAGSALTLNFTRGRIVAVEDGPALPATLQLEQNYPNPFSGSTRIVFSVPTGGHRQLRLEVFDVRGRRVATLADGPRSPGRHEVQWDGTLPSGQRVAGGLYLYRLVQGRQQLVKSMILIH